MGGLKEKLLAALREGVQTVVLPGRCAPRSRSFRWSSRGLEIVYVKTFREVLPHVLRASGAGGDQEGTVSMTEVTMAARYSPHEVEERLMQEWLARSAFHATAEDPVRRTPS